jgi:hypothetical protein
MRDRLCEIRDSLFFIVGPHRSGTTLLQAMLSSHSAITIPPETGFFDQVWPRRQSFGPLTNAENLRRVGDFLNGPNCSVADLQLDWDDVVGKLGQTSAGYADLFAILLMQYADARGKRRIGEKSPRHLFHVHSILEVFPQAKFICLIRDPRAVVRSELETTWGSKSVGRIAARWCRVARAVGELGTQLKPSQFRLVRYEELVETPEPVLRGLCEFLGEQFESAMLTFQERPAAEQGFRPDEVWKQNTLRPVDVSRIDHWRTELSPAQIRLIEIHVTAGMEQLGYPQSGVAVTQAQYARAMLGDRLRWFREVCWGLLRGRSRRRPWKEVLRDLFTK